MLALFAISVFLLAAIIGGKSVCRPFDKAAVVPLRGVLVLLVVTGHVGDALGLDYSMANQAVAVFFFLSGYGLMKKRILCSGPDALRGGFVRAIIKLLPTFLIAACAYAGWEIAMGHRVPLWTNICKGSSNLPIPFTWYVPAVIALYGIFYAADRICKKKGQLIVCICAGVLGYWVLTALVFQWPFYWWKTVGGFAAGVIFAELEKLVLQVIAERPRVVYGVSLLLFLSVFAVTRVDAFVVRFAAQHLYSALLGPIVALILFRFALAGRVLDFLGVYSYEIYIVHGAFVYGLLHSCATRSLYCIAVIACAIVAGVSLRVFRKFLDRIAIRIAGGRRG